MCQINPNKIIEMKILIPAEGTKVQQNGIDLTLLEDLTLSPTRRFENVALQEFVNIPDRMIGIIFARSSMNRVGLQITSGLWDSGFVGRIGCSMAYLGNDIITIPKKTRVAQIVFISGDNHSMYNGFYSNQNTMESKFQHSGGIGVEIDKRIA